MRLSSRAQVMITAGDLFLKLVHAAQEREPFRVLYLKTILESSEHMLQTTQRMKDNRNEYAELAMVTAALALAIEKHIQEHYVGFGKQGSKLKSLSSMLDKIDAFVVHTTMLSWFTRFKGRHAIKETIAKFVEQLDKEAKRFDISPESHLARWLLLRETQGKCKTLNLWIDFGEQPEYNSQMHNKRKMSNVITIATSEGLRDLSLEVQILGSTPAGRGAHSLIWPGKLSSGSRVAVKQFFQDYPENIQEGSMRKFLREVRVWSSVMHHENVLPLLGVALLRDSVALISPWMGEGSLGTYVTMHPEANIEELLADVARGLTYLHSKGIVYNNLHMSTVLVSNAERAYLSSFLAAVSYRNSDTPSSDTSDESPERVSSVPISRKVHDSIPPTFDETREWTATYESDVFSFGNLIMAVFSKRSKQIPMIQSVFGPSRDLMLRRPHSLQGLEEDLWGIVQSCWTFAAADRPTMSEVARRMVYLSEGRIMMSNPALLNNSEPPRTLRDISGEIKKLSEHPIAGGGYSDLYLGERLGHEKVALKLIRFFNSMGPDMGATLRRFRNGASLWAEFWHPRILEFYGICNYGSGALFMVTPFLKNGTALEYLSKFNPDADRVSILSQAAEGLLYLHSRYPPVVHGDMKASNILVTDEGTAVLADFGLSKLSNEMTTTMLQGVGSPRWMAPELVAVGDHDTGPVKTNNSDIYAYGHVILEILSDQLPFFHLKEDVHVLVELIRQGRSPRPDGPVADAWLHDSAWTFSRDCTAIDPKERPGIELVVSQIHRLRKVLPDFAAAL